ncbi:LysE family translocator [Marinomonas sp. 15G1-11]|uniref:LysE family translocator n=1 Tax=Marinomonas phaeophyticola TaxID=3004091 RepID=A0ABT4JQN7_9GAMM|nr:LysE family translocator [Marinomonas sp. 15G1-11]MCZ2720680.1 LysE family translocator [Marinomonas sp. 15G1-11]
MEWTFLLSVALFAFVTSVTPGPNNIMLLASGAQFGFMRTVPHIVGILLGVAMLLVSVLTGLGVMFNTFPILYDILKWLGAAYLLWLSYKITFASVKDDTDKKELAPTTPFSWWQAALFQFVNPKAWMMTIGCVSTFSMEGDAYIASAIWIVVLFASLGLPAICLWAGLGVSIGRLLTNPKRKRLFNYVMGGATASTLLMVIA